MTYEDWKGLGREWEDTSKRCEKGRGIRWYAISAVNTCEISMVMLIIYLVTKQERLTGKM